MKRILLFVLSTMLPYAAIVALGCRQLPEPAQTTSMTPAAVWICPMGCPHGTSDKPGKCPDCKMPLVLPSKSKESDRSDGSGGEEQEAFGEELSLLTPDPFAVHDDLPPPIPQPAPPLPMPSTQERTWREMKGGGWGMFLDGKQVLWVAKDGEAVEWYDSASDQFSTTCRRPSKMPSFTPTPQAPTSPPLSFVPATPMPMRQAFYGSPPQTSGVWQGGGGGSRGRPLPRGGGAGVFCPT